jgi:predicted  nucleic acid-binding Zn-ribbon protein
VVRSPVSTAIAALVLAGPLAACASGRVKVDLDPARTAVAEARKAGAPARSAESFTRAEEHLQRAEALAAGNGVRRDRRAAQRAADLAVAEATCATALTRAMVKAEQTTTRAAATVAASTAEVDRLSARLKKAEEDQRRLEEDQRRLEDKIAVLTRDLEVTETELIRTKARLKGNETKAEASAAIAEARILAGRLAEDKTRASVLARSEESLGKAEEQLSAGNYGAALFFASKAQDLVARVKPGGDEGEPAGGSSAPLPSLSTYVSRAVARIRKGPGLSEEILGRLPSGTQVTSEAVSGEWVRVTYRGLSGWVHSSLLQ